MTYEQFENLPFRGSMARTSKHERNCSYGSKVSSFFGWVHRFAQKNVGKSFDMAYHYVCKKFPNNYGYISPKEEFKVEVNYHEDPWRSRWKSLHVDADRIIRMDKPEPRDRSLKVPVSEKNFCYKLKPMSLAEENKLYLWLASNFGRNSAISVFVTGIIPHPIAEYILGTNYWSLRYADSASEIRHLFEQVDLTEYKMYKRGTKAFKRYYVEQHKRQCKRTKTSAQEQSSVDPADLALKKDNQSKKAKKAEIARARRAKILRNIIDRDRLGFGEDSFMGPNYNSRKGRKEKRLLEGKDVV